MIFFKRSILSLLISGGLVSAACVAGDATYSNEAVSVDRFNVLISGMVADIKSADSGDNSEIVFDDVERLFRDIPADDVFVEEQGDRLLVGMEKRNFVNLKKNYKYAAFLKCDMGDCFLLDAVEIGGDFSNERQCLSSLKLKINERYLSYLTSIDKTLIEDFYATIEKSVSERDLNFLFGYFVSDDSLGESTDIGMFPLLIELLDTNINLPAEQFLVYQPLLERDDERYKKPVIGSTLNSMARLALRVRLGEVFPPNAELKIVPVDRHVEKKVWEKVFVQWRDMEFYYSNKHRLTECIMSVTRDE